MILIFSLVVLIGLIEDRATFPAKVLPPKACFGPAEDSFEDGNGIGVVLSSLDRDVQSNFLFGPANVFAFYVELHLDFARNSRMVLDRYFNNRTLFHSDLPYARVAGVGGNCTKFPMTNSIRFLAVSLVFICSAILLPAAKGQVADLAVTKSGPAQAAAGSDVTYTIELFNLGPDNSVTATLTDQLPPGTTFVSLSKPVSWTCSTPTVGSGGTITCTNPSVPLGADDLFTLVVHLDQATAPGTTITNVATVTTPPDPDNGDTDPNSENNTGVASTTVPGGNSTSADLGVTKTADTDQVLANSDVTYTIQVRNEGPDTSTDAELRDALPADMTFVSLAQTSGPVWACSVPAVGSGGTIICTNSGVAAGSTSTFTLVGHVPAGAAPGTSYGNQALVLSAMDPNTENNNSFTNTTVVAAAPALTTAASGPIVFGGTISDTATLSGGANATGTITFYAYGPDDTECAGPAAFVSGISVSGDNQYGSGSFQPLAAGTYRFVATYSGDDNNKAVATACGDPNESVVVSKANTGTTVTSSANPSVSGQSVTFTATITPAASAPATPGGTVQFVVDSSNFGGPVPVSGGVAQLSTSSLGVGNHSVTAQYSGDANFNSSNGALPGGQTVNPAPTPTPTPTGTPGPTATPTATPGPTPAQALNISTRLRVDIGDKVMIGGFIIRGNTSKPVVLRGLGRSLASSGVPAATVLNDPFLELHGPNGALIMMNDNWKESPQRSQIEGTVFQPADDREAVILATLAPGSYTAILSGVGQTTGVGLVEVYDNNQALDSDLANISTRGFVLTGDNVMIGGFTLGGNNNATRIAVRGLGPSLTNSGLSNVLADPTLELHNANGTIMVSNDDWQSDAVSAAALTANGLALPNPKESGIFTSLAPPGQFTAILAGKNGGTGIGLVEIYNLK
jgi:uncharacterized repeat protein (TIGR01451 family)